jgi:hypothetical protein
MTQLSSFRPAGESAGRMLPRTPWGAPGVWRTTRCRASLAYSRGMKVDSAAIAQLTHHLRRAADELPVEHAVIRVSPADFQSPVADALTATNADLIRQASAVAEFIDSLAAAGDEAAERLLAIDAAVAQHAAREAAPGASRGLTAE